MLDKFIPKNFFYFLDLIRFNNPIGFLLLIPLTRKILIGFFIKRNTTPKNQENINTLDGEIIEDKDKKDEL